MQTGAFDWEKDRYLSFEELGEMRRTSAAQFIGSHKRAQRSSSGGDGLILGGIIGYLIGKHTCHHD